MEHKYYLTINGYQLTTEPKTVDEIIRTHGDLQELERLGYRLVKDLNQIDPNKRKIVNELCEIFQNRKDNIQVFGLSSDKNNRA